MQVIAVEFIVNPENAATFEAAMSRHAQNSLREPGCTRFDLARDPEQPGRYMLWENYVDEAAVAFHREQASIKEVGAKIGPIVVERNLSMLEMIDTAGT